MLINEFTVPLATLLPGSRPISNGKGNTLIGELSTDSATVRAYTKLLDLPTLSKEVLCAVLARKLHLPVPQPYYVQVDPSATGKPQGNVHGLAFALEEDQALPGLRFQEAEELDTQLKNWSDLERCAIFDIWIANKDRTPYNLLYQGANQFVIIDHEEALPEYMSVKSHVGAQLILILAEKKTEFEKHQIKKKLLKIAEDYKTISWADIREFVRYSELKFLMSHYDRCIDFLRARVEYLSEILSVELGLAQSELPFTNDANPNQKAEN